MVQKKKKKRLQKADHFVLNSTGVFHKGWAVSEVYPVPVSSLVLW